MTPNPLSDRQILVCNCGSSSVKIDVFGTMPDSKTELRFLFAARAGRVGSPKCSLHLKLAADDGPGHDSSARLKTEASLDLPEASHAEVITRLSELFSDYGLFPEDKRLAIGHRVVHGAHFVDRPILLDESNKKIIEKCIEFAPLHNPVNLKGIEACERLFGVPQVGVFDTAFHRNMPEAASSYAIPRELAERHHLRRYGFHGTSHEYVGRVGARALGRPFEELRLITLHLGNGASACAIQNGTSIDTSMGFTPLEGLIMGTRCGDLDPALVALLAEREGLDWDGIDRLLNKQSGLLGLAGVSDMRDLLERASNGEANAALGRDAFIWRVRKYIGAYLAHLNGADAIIFTGGIGEHASQIREGCVSRLDGLGIYLDESANRNPDFVQGSKGESWAQISLPESPIRVLVIPTDEERMIAQKTLSLVLSPSKTQP